MRDGGSGKWMEFTSLCRIVTTNQIDEVLPLIRQIEQSVNEDGLYAAGFISYEAAPACDSSLPAKADGKFPLLWFGLFQRAGEISLPDTTEKQCDSLQWQPAVTREEYDRCIHAIHDFIQSGDTYQVNFTCRFQSQAEMDAWSLFVRMAGDSEAPFAGFVDTGEWAICSLSPELFFLLDGSHIESRPMKGTAARGLWFEDDQIQKNSLICSGKERAENLMIVDMVRNDLGRIAIPGSIHVPFLLEAEKYPTLWQLTSTVVAQTQETLDRIFQATFPPASITGAPKRRTMEIIASLESTPRRIYTGTIGFIAPGRRAQFNVAIRTILLHKPTARAEYGAGGGIVWDSTPEKEYQEIQTKTKVLNSYPRDFDLLESMLWSAPVGYWLLDHHLKRLARSADYFGFQVDIHTIRQEVLRVAANLSSGSYKVRLLVSRFGGVRCEAGLLESTVLVGFGRVRLAKNPITTNDIFLYHKTTRRTAYVEAHKICPGYDDVLLYNDSGQITESTRANIAVEIEGRLYTPPLHCGLLAGTQRAWLLESGQLQEKILTVQTILASQNVYLLNSVRGMQKIELCHATD